MTGHGPSEGSWQKIEHFFVRPTGTWAERTPKIDADRCRRCGLCFIFCPTGCIAEKEDAFAPDLDHCKGCGTCAHECPARAIEMVRRRG